jgi:hypothetical protein
VRSYRILPLLVVGCGRLGFETVDRRTDAAIDTPPPNLACPAHGEMTRALFAFDSSTADATGGAPATIVGTVPFVDGPAGCGMALSFTGDLASYVVIQDSPRWDLDVGSLSFWLWVRSIGVDQGVITRDQSGTAVPGHLNIEVDRGGRLGVRIQTTTATSVVCSNDVLPLATWVRVRLRLGAPRLELELDGTRQTGTGELEVFLGNPCDAGMPYGIDGNDVPWVIGANTGRSDGMLNGLDQPFDGMIDHVEVSASR